MSVSVGSTDPPLYIDAPIRRDNEATQHIKGNVRMKFSKETGDISVTLGERFAKYSRCLMITFKVPGNPPIEESFRTTDKAKLRHFLQYYVYFFQGPTAERTVECIGVNTMRHDVSVFSFSPKDRPDKFLKLEFEHNVELLEMTVVEEFGRCESLTREAELYPQDDERRSLMHEWQARMDQIKAAFKTHAGLQYRAKLHLINNNPTNQNYLSDAAKHAALKEASDEFRAAADLPRVL